MESGKKCGWIVSLRAFAAMAIVLLHVISTWTVENSWGGELSPQRYILDGVVVQVLVRWAVPVFVMILGYLLLDPDKDMALIKVHKYKGCVKNGNNEFIGAGTIILAGVSIGDNVIIGAGGGNKGSSSKQSIRGKPCEMNMFDRSIY